MDDIEDGVFPDDFDDIPGEAKYLLAGMIFTLRVLGIEDDMSVFSDAQRAALAQFGGIVAGRIMAGEQESDAFIREALIEAAVVQCLDIGIDLKSIPRELVGSVLVTACEILRLKAMQQNLQATKEIRDLFAPFFGLK